jgi:hypothetical protein
MLMGGIIGGQKVTGKKPAPSKSDQTTGSIVISSVPSGSVRVLIR